MEAKCKVMDIGCLGETSSLRPTVRPSGGLDRVYVHKIYITFH